MFTQSNQFDNTLHEPKSPLSIHNEWDSLLNQNVINLVWLQQINNIKIMNYNYHRNKDTVNLFHYLLTLIICCNESLFLIILNSLFTYSLHFPSVFTHGFIQLFFNVMNWIKIINQVWLGLLSRIKRTDVWKMWSIK